MGLTVEMKKWKCHFFNKPVMEMSNHIQMRGVFKPGGGSEPSVMFLGPFLSKLWQKWVILSC